jgi:4-amino-4-deoxy-L-arabinose transferase-like glycosyltransferase
MFFNGKDSGRIAGQISAVALLLLSFWVLCYRLDSLPMFLWDESRQANNALEMLNSGNLWYTTYDGKPDFWNTKPHLLVLLQWGCMKLLGPGLLALRLPSAIAGCIVLWVGFVHLNKRFGFEPAAAWVAVMIGCGGFNTYHIVRTGDYDALLTLFVFLASLSWLKYLENTHEIKFLKYMAIWFTAAILTKGVAAAMWLPCWIAMGYGIKPRADLKGKRVAMYAIIPLLCVFIYYGFHEWHTPGYLHAVLDNEFSGRYLKPNEGHASPWYYYIEVLWSSYFAGFLLLMPVAGFFIKRSEIRIIHYRLLIGIVLFLIIISLSATRIYWYLAPVIPLMALVVVLPLCINIHAGFKLAVKLLIAAITVYGYFENYHHNNVATGVSSAKVLLEAEKNGKLPFQAVWHAGHYHPVEKYYAAILAAKGIDLKYSSVYDYKSGDTLIVSSMDHLDTLNRRLYMRQQLYPTDELPVWVMVVDSAKRH